MLDKDIIVDFQTEAKGLLKELTEVVEKLEEPGNAFPAQELEQFAQRIDRIMGAAQTLNQLDPQNEGLKRIGSIAQICKQLGYKAAEYKTAALIPLFAAFWADVLEVMEELIDSLEDDKGSRELAESFSSVLQKRLAWLGQKIQQMAPAGAGNTQLEMEKLLGSLKK